MDVFKVASNPLMNNKIESNSKDLLSNIKTEEIDTEECKLEFENKYEFDLCKIKTESCVEKLVYPIKTDVLLISRETLKTENVDSNKGNQEKKNYMEIMTNITHHPFDFLVSRNDIHNFGENRQTLKMYSSTKIQEQPYKNSMFTKEPKSEMLSSENDKSEIDISSQTTLDNNLEFECKKELLHSICDLPDFKMKLQDFDKELHLERRIKRYSRKQNPSYKKRFLSTKKKWQTHFGKFSGSCFSCGKFYVDKYLFLNHFCIYHVLVNSKKFFNLRRNNSATKHIKRQDRSYLNKQMKTHSFTRKSALKIHIKTHTREKPFKCIICSTCFTHSGNLKTYIRTHTDEKPFKCNICSKCFTQSSHLKSHIKSHTGEKPFKCTICSNCFTQLNNLKSHIKSHTGEKPFKCKICSKCFTRSSTLKSHIKTHTGEKQFKCKICSKCFTRSSDLKCHIKLHTNEKPFKCKFCSKCYTQSGGLKSHIGTHTNEKPFKCKICTKCFTQSSSLNRHIKTHTNKKPF